MSKADVTVAQQIAAEIKLERIRKAIAESASRGDGRPCDWWVAGECRLTGSYYEPHSQSACWCWAQAENVSKAMESVGG